MYAYPQESQPSGNLTPNIGNRGQVNEMNTIHIINFLCLIHSHFSTMLSSKMDINPSIDID
ncbi:Uncharacterised protein [Staphylococcus intermedius NCTC 11048]|uniref:Uncharacterized protein n=1 Tax=Staphylococcus intermedius NCTC 11048 TaxID=1141106 RepID=A0A380G7V6_STAIN|nr:Uncharacterised protein [Staphylococcus intermedius NCTC 11048]